MSNFYRLRHATLVVALAFALFGLTLHGVAAQAPDPAGATVPDAESCIDLSVRGQRTLANSMALLLTGDREFSETEVFRADELIVGGSLANINEFSQTVSTELGIDLISARKPFSMSGEAYQLFRIDSETISHANSVRRVICEAQRLRDSGAFSQTLFAEPNYLVSASQWWAGGSAWRDDQESVYTLEHSAVQSTLANYNGYQEQWALGADGINLRVNGSRAISQTGAGTRVVIFDTSPFRQSGSFSLTTFVDGQETAVLTLDARQAFSQTTFDGTAFPDHGPYVAGLVHAVAPAAQIELVRVLNNETGTTTLYDLLLALGDFLNGGEEEEEEPPGIGTVINLSLGVHHPITPTFATQAFFNTYGSALTISDTFGFPSEVISLKRVLRQAHERGALIVAAAGNDFAFGDANSRWAEAPASYDFVLGVGGSNIAGARSCFSNNGDVFAPGGDGADANCSTPPGGQCSSNPEACLVSVLHQFGDDGINANFGYWVGSSFAAPQVSGLAALILEEATSGNLRAAQQPPTAQEILDVIRCSADARNGETSGVIDVQRALSEECLVVEAVSPGALRFRQGSVSVAEDAGAVELVIERINGSDGAASVAWATFDGTATPGEDYPASAGNAGFADGESTFTLSIPIVDDSTLEPDESFIVRLSSIITGSATITEPLDVVVTIVNDDSAPPGVLQFPQPLYRVAEDVGQVIITVQRTGGVRDEVQVSYRTRNGTAEFPRDYTSNLGTLAFADDQTEQRFTVELIDDAGDEPDETFTIELENVVGVATLGEVATTTVLILDNDGDPPLPDQRATYLPLVQH